MLGMTVYLSTSTRQKYILSINKPFNTKTFIHSFPLVGNYPISLWILTAGYSARRTSKGTSVSFSWWGVKETTVVCLAQITEIPVEETRWAKEVISQKVLLGHEYWADFPAVPKNCHLIMKLPLANKMMI